MELVGTFTQFSAVVVSLRSAIRKDGRARGEQTSFEGQGLTSDKHNICSLVPTFHLVVLVIVGAGPGFPLAP